MAKTKYKRSGLLYSVLNLKIIILLSNLIFQGARYMEKGELLYKLSITFIIALILYFSGLNLATSFIIGHIANYIFNGQFFVVYRYLFASKVLTRNKLDSTLNICANLAKSKHVRDVLFIGSLCRNDLKESSDIDIRIFHDAGFVSSIFAYFNATKLRFWGLIYRVPVDVFCFSDLSFLKKIDKSEIPLFINGEQYFKSMYPDAVSVFTAESNL